MRNARAPWLWSLLWSSWGRCCRWVRCRCGCRRRRRCGYCTVQYRNLLLVVVVAVFAVVVVVAAVVIVVRVVALV